MSDIKPELVEKAAKAAYCESIVPKYREHMWSIADIGTTEAYYREARAALEAVADELRAEAWDEGFGAGHEAARSVNPEWPDLPTNPHRKEVERP